MPKKATSSSVSALCSEVGKYSANLGLVPTVLIFKK